MEKIISHSESKDISCLLEFEKRIIGLSKSYLPISEELKLLKQLNEFPLGRFLLNNMRYVLSEAKRLGARHCFLESSDSGLGVYQKLGFEPLFKNNIYSRKA